MMGKNCLTHAPLPSRPEPWQSTLNSIKGEDPVLIHFEEIKSLQKRILIT